MAIEKFIPASPDLDIVQDSDLAPAKFGHLNKIVNYINDNNLAEVSITGPVTTEAVVSDATLGIKINGVEYKLLLKA
jgi:hypothetical protein